MDDQYELLDFGGGRKLERFAGTLVDRPSPQATERPLHPNLWRAHLCYRRSGTNHEDRDAWVGEAPADWTFRCGGACYHLKPAPTGQVGIFPEQIDNWSWLEQQMARLEGEDPKILNLFAYTGGSTLAVAAKASEVVHLDSSKPVVQWARQNAELSGMHGLPIRWIVDDVSKFIARELRRNRQYHGIILDPPTFGRGPSGERWQIEINLSELLEQLATLLVPHGFLLLTCHTTNLTKRELHRWLHPITLAGQGQAEWRPLALETAQKESLASGIAWRWAGKQA